MAYPLLDQVAVYTRLLESRDGTMPKRMCRSDVDSNLIAKRLQHVPVDVSHYQWSAVSAFEETTALTIADMLLQHRHHVWMDVDGNETLICKTQVRNRAHIGTSDFPLSVSK